MKTIVRIQAEVPVPCVAEEATMDALRELPEASPELLLRRSGMDEALRRLAACRIATAEAEAAAKEASARLRELVARDWRPEEIPQAVREILSVW